MLVSLLALVIAISALYVSRQLTDEIMSLVSKLIGLLGLLLSLVCSPWLIKLFILLTIVAPDCARQNDLQQSRCSPVCITRLSCPYSSA